MFREAESLERRPARHLDRRLIHLLEHFQDWCIPSKIWSVAGLKSGSHEKAVLDAALKKLLRNEVPRSAARADFPLYPRDDARV